MITNEWSQFVAVKKKDATYFQIFVSFALNSHSEVSSLFNIIQNGDFKKKLYCNLYNIILRLSKYDYFCFSHVQFWFMNFYSFSAFQVCPRSAPCMLSRGHPCPNGLIFFMFKTVKRHENNMKFGEILFNTNQTNKYTGSKIVNGINFRIHIYHKLKKSIFSTG